MDLRNVLFILLGAITMPAAAVMPVVALNGDVSATSWDADLRDCNKSSFERGYGELIQKIHVMPIEDEHGNKIPDPRVSLKAQGVNSGLTPQEVARIQGVTGSVICTGDKYHNALQGTGTLAANNVIITVAHLFIDEQGRSSEPCYFQRKEYPYAITKLELNSQNTTFYTKDPVHDKPHDLALIRLPNGISSAQPFSLDRLDRLPPKGTKLTTISASQIDLLGKIKDTDMVLQQCFSKDSYPATNQWMSIIYSNCSATDEASGSISFVRINGELTMKAVLVASGADAKNGREFDLKNGSYTLSIKIDSNVIREIDRLSTGKESVPGNSASNLPATSKKLSQNEI